MPTLLDKIASLDPWIIMIFAVIIFAVDLLILNTQFFIWLGASLILVAIENKFELPPPTQIITIILFTGFLSFIQVKFNKYRKASHWDEEFQKLNELPESNLFVGEICEISKIIEFNSVLNRSIDNSTPGIINNYSSAIFTQNEFSTTNKTEIKAFVSLKDNSTWEVECDNELKIGDLVKVIERKNGKLKVQFLASK